MKKIIFISLATVLFVTGCTFPGLSKDGKSAKKPITIDEAKIKVTDFINKNLMQPGTEVTVKEMSEEDGLYKAVISIPDGQEINSYMTKDGTKFFPQVMDIDELSKQNEQKKDGTGEVNGETAVAEVPKTAKPKVELFVMSHCPYGTQIEKGIIPVIETLKDKMDFELKFCDYAMHGKKELDEQLNQYCIQKNEPDKLLAYLNCFLAESDAGEKCLTSAKINKSKLNACVKSTDTEYKVTELFNDKNTWTSGQFPQFNVFKADNEKYGVKGSPTLVINGQTASSARDADSLLKVICGGFETAPEECNTELSAASPAPGFGTGTSGGSTDAGCATN